jgi:hypothetical protein
MDEKVQQAQDELASQVQETPRSLEDVIAGLKGFGVEEIEDILALKSKGYKVDVRLANIPTSDEMSALLAAEEYKGYLWIKRVKIEILSRAVSWIGGKSLRGLTPAQRLVPDPTDNGVLKDVQVVLRNLMMTWGEEVTEVLWRVLMVHSQKIEDRLKEEFPDSAIMTEVERRLFEQAMKYIESSQQKAIVDEAEDIFKETSTQKPEEGKAS